MSTTSALLKWCISVLFFIGLEQSFCVRKIGVAACCICKVVLNFLSVIKLLQYLCCTPKIYQYVDIILRNNLLDDLELGKLRSACKILKGNPDFSFGRITVYKLAKLACCDNCSSWSTSLHIFAKFWKLCTYAMMMILLFAT